ncbi:MAG: cardiolipin synthase ClsB [Proteobacteria bacterium]|nr:cardiolipin synthase ClsB [Pseudomonadota bacterium]MBU1687076.1 cardiolipin synthase ClsB [Pseudomonadota bacterium]
MSQGKRHRQDLYHALLPPKVSRFFPDNRVILLQNGAEYFPALEAAFDQAKHEIYLETYIYEDDAAGQMIAAALGRAVLRGVKVHLLIDGYGCKDLSSAMLERLQADGVQTLIYRPKISPWTFQRKRLRRLHRKIVVVDREIAFVGGINIVDDRTTLSDLPPRFDYAVSVQGPLVEVIRLSAQHLWSLVAWTSFRKGTILDRTPPVATTTGGRMNAAFLVRDNIRHRRDIEAAYLAAIDGAESEIILANAYFLPGYHFRHALIKAAGRGVRVVLLLQGKYDHFLQHYAAQALYGSFLDGGIEIYEFHKSFLHAKVAVIDGHWATVGSSNIDPFSLLLSREANVVVDDREFGASMAESLHRTMAGDGRRIVRDIWKTQPLGLRLMSWLCFGFLRLMMGISGYAK